jgi:hypothetical protein
MEKALTRMLNKILMCEDPLLHAGRFASLVNSWVNVHKLSLEEEEIAAIKKRLDAIEQMKIIENEKQKIMINGGKIEQLEESREAN